MRKMSQILPSAADVIGALREISNTDYLKVPDKTAPIFICFRMRFLSALFSSST